MKEFPDLMCPEVQLAFEALTKALKESATARGIQMVSVAASWLTENDDMTVGFSMFDGNMTPENAEAMAAVLLLDADHADFQVELDPVRRQ